jgi:hypothetical protein
MGDRYGRLLVEDIEYRQDQVKKVGLGFALPPTLFGLPGLQIELGSRKGSPILWVVPTGLAIAVLSSMMRSYFL